MQTVLYMNKNNVYWQEPADKHYYNTNLALTEVKQIISKR